MRLYPLALAASCAAMFLAPSARGDDTKAPVISDVKANAKGGAVVIEAKITDDTGVLQAIVYSRRGGGKWSELQMTKEEFGDAFKATVGAADEYYIQATDLLGNGPSSFGSAAKPMALGGGKGKTAVAAAEPPPPPPPAEPPPPPPEPREPKPRKPRPEPSVVAAAAAPPEPRAPRASSKPPPPVIQHRKPGSALNDGQQFTLRITIKADAGIKLAALYGRPAGTAEWKAKVPLTRGEGDSYSVVIPETLAHGDVEYIIVALDNAGQQVNQGDGSASNPYKVTFKPPAGGTIAAAAAPVSGGSGASLIISHASPFRIEPRKTFVLRAQVSPGNIEQLAETQAAEAEAKIAGASVKLLYRGQDANDQVMDMMGDPSGGLGGFAAELPAQFDGEVIYYQVVACVAEECAIDTGSKKKWNSIRISATPGEGPPTIDAVSSKAPANLPE